MNKKFLSILLLSTAALVMYADTPAKDARVVAPKASETAKEPLKVGVVSATQIMMETDNGMEASKVIEDKRNGYMKQAQSRATDIEKKAKEFEVKVSSGTMSADSQRTESTKLANLKQELELDQKKWMQDLQLDAQREMENLGKHFDTAVQQVAKSTHADLVFEKESGRIVFAADHLNITDSVKVAMNTEHKATKLASAKKDQAKATA